MISYTHSENKNNVVNANNGRTLTFNYPCSSPTTCSPYVLSLKRGFYFLEVFGAQGSNSTLCTPNAIGGKGGFSSGVFRADVDLTLYLYIGATSLTSQSIDSNFGGGGYGPTINDGPGGGATDFRLNTSDLYSRIIVAGGGGGGFCTSTKDYKGGDGGGFEGKVGLNYDGARPCIGTQTSCKDGMKKADYRYYEGTFGQGSGGAYGGGGGGYWGGGNIAGGGAGGSGYIGGVFGNNIYKRTTVSGKNPGFGWARITPIHFNCVLTARVGFSPSHVFLLSFLVTL